MSPNCVSYQSKSEKNFYDEFPPPPKKKKKLEHIIKPYTLEK